MSGSMVMQTHLTKIAGNFSAVAQLTTHKRWPARANPAVLAACMGAVSVLAVASLWYAWRPAAVRAERAPTSPGAANSGANVASNEKCGVCQLAAQYRCAACKTATYCSRACQKSHWHDHKHACSGRESKPGNGKRDVHLLLSMQTMMCLSATSQHSAALQSCGTVHRRAYKNNRPLAGLQSLYVEGSIHLRRQSFAEAKRVLMLAAVAGQRLLLRASVGNSPCPAPNSHSHDDVASMRRQASTPPELVVLTDCCIVVRASVPSTMEATLCIVCTDSDANPSAHSFH
jgi:MYND finger